MGIEIFDLIAKISWETNQAAIDKVGDASRAQSKLLDELRTKGKRLEEQILKTNDPKKLSALNAEYQNQRKAAEAIINTQKTQIKLTEQLREKQKDFLTQLQKTNDPKTMQGLMRNLQQVENQLKSMGGTAKDLPSKFSGIGKSILEGFGIGVGMFGIQAAAQAITGFVSGAIAEAEDASKTAKELQRSLKVIGKEKYFDGLVSEADALQKQFKDLYDNDDIIKAQTNLVNYGKVSRDELSKLLPVVMELASAEGIDLVSASEKIINILEGRGGQTLRQYGVSVKDVKTVHERLNIVLGEFNQKLIGSSDTLASTAEGQRKILQTTIKGLEEDIGDRLLPIYEKLLNVIHHVIRGMGITAKSASSAFTGRFGGLGMNTEKLIEEQAKKDALSSRSMAPSDGTDAGALNSNAAKEKTEEEKAAEKEAEKARKEAAKKKRDEAIREAKEHAALLKKIKANQVQEEIANQRDISERPDVTNELAQIQANQDLIVKNEREKLAEPLIKAEEDFAREKAKRIAKAEADEAKRLKRQQTINDLQDGVNSLSNLANEVNQVIALRTAETDALIALQEKRVEAARNSSGKSLQIEQKRLDDLTAKRVKYEKEQRTINAGVILANQALAISNGVVGVSAAVKSGNALLIATNLIAILGALTAGYAAVRSVNAPSGYKEGGYTGDGDPSDVSTNLGSRGYTYHKKEFVMNEGLTTKHRDMLEGMHKGRLMVKQLEDGSYYLHDKSIDVDKAVQNHYDINQSMNMTAVLGELQCVRALLEQREVKINNNFDADGFGISVANSLGNVHLKSLRRVG